MTSEPNWESNLAPTTSISSKKLKKRPPKILRRITRRPWAPNQTTKRSRSQIFWRIWMHLLWAIRERRKSLILWVWKEKIRARCRGQIRCRRNRRRAIRARWWTEECPDSNLEQWKMRAWKSRIRWSKAWCRQASRKRQMTMNCATASLQNPPWVPILGTDFSSEIKLIKFHKNQLQNLKNQI